MESQDVNVVASCNSEQSTKASTTYPSSSAFEQPPSEQKEEEPIQTNRTDDAVSVCDSAYHSFLNFVGTSATDYYTKRIYDEDVHAVASVDTFDFEDANVDSNIKHDVVSVVTDYFTAGGTSHIDNGGNNKDTSPRLMHDESNGMLAKMAHGIQNFIVFIACAFSNYYSDRLQCEIAVSTLFDDSFWRLLTK